MCILWNTSGRKYLFPPYFLVEILLEQYLSVALSFCSSMMESSSFFLTSLPSFLVYLSASVFLGFFWTFRSSFTCGSVYFRCVSHLFSLSCLQKTPLFTIMLSDSANASSNLSLVSQNQWLQIATDSPPSHFLLIRFIQILWIVTHFLVQLR